MIEKILEDRKVKILIVFVAVSLLLVLFNGVSTGLDLQGGSLIQIQTEKPLSVQEMEQVTTIMDDRLRGGLKVRDVKVKPWGDQYILVYLAGVPATEAANIIGKPGKLIVRIGNYTVFTGDELDRVDPFSYEARSSSWGVPFTISNDAAERFRDAAVETNFERVYMYMDEGTQIKIRTGEEIAGLEEVLNETMGKGFSIDVGKGQLGVTTTVTSDRALDELDSSAIERITEFVNESAANLTSIKFERTGLVNSAPIAESLEAELRMGSVVKSLLLTTGGGDDGREEARRIEIILRSGALPVKVSIVGSHDISAALGEGFKDAAIFSGIIAFLGVAAVVSIRYRKPKFVLPILVTGASEVVIILGAASLIKWDIDLPAIAGIIAALGTGMDNQIVILDEILFETEKSMRYKIKNAFFIVMSSWGTLIGAMVPLFIVGFGMLQGFAVTTIIGATAGVFITRPAYAQIVMYMSEDVK